MVTNGPKRRGSATSHGALVGQAGKGEQASVGQAGVSSGGSGA